MHAVIFKVSIHQREQAEKFLKEQIVPRVSQAPGFVAGHWANFGDRGQSMIVFESEEAARAVADNVDPPPADIVTIESVEVGEVVASA